METIKIIIPPKPGQEHLYDHDAPLTMDIACRSMCSSLSKEADLPSSKLPFTWKLYEMLENVTENGQDHIVSWVDGGRAFRVHNLDDFTNKVIPIYFKQSKYKSFQRQLYFYNFKRVSKGSGIGSYYHPMFVRGEKTRVLSMTPKKNNRRKSAAGKNVRADVTLSRQISEDAPHSTETPYPENCRRVSMETSDEPSPEDNTVYATWFQNDQDSEEARRVSFTKWEHNQAVRVSPSHNIQHHWQEFIEQQEFDPFDGETCRVFGDMAFHFVAGVPKF
ncbi:MAG: hypothetical protein SGILL_010482 [Bacillariaceae sp.]